MKKITLLITFVCCLVMLYVLNSEGSIVVAQKSSNETMSLEFVGLRGNDLSREQALNLGYQEPIGFFVTDVRPSSPANQSGLMQNDTIFEVDDQRVENTDSLISYLSGKKIDDWLSFTVARGHEMMHIDISPTYDSLAKLDNSDILTSDSPDPFCSTYVYGPEFSNDGSKLYSESNLILAYPSNLFDLNNESYDSYSSSISLVPTNNTDSNIENFSFIINETQKMLSAEERATWWADDLNQSHIYYQELSEIERTNDIDMHPTFTFDYSYHDPYKGKVCGVLMTTTFNNTEITITYENTREKFRDWLPQIKGIIDSIELIEYKPVLWEERGIYFMVPVNWQPNITSNNTRFILSNSSHFDVNYSQSNPVINNSCAQFAYKNTSSDVTNDGSENLRCIYSPKDGPFKISFDGNYEDLKRYWPYINGILITENNREIFSANHTSLPERLVPFKGKNVHPFHIDYPTSWNFSEDVAGEVDKAVTFQPKGSDSAKIRVSYWNENDLPMAEIENEARLGFSDELSGFYDESDFSNGDLDGKTVIYYSNQEDGIWISKVFYLRGNDDKADSNIAITYEGYVDEYLKFWPDAEKMIDSVELHDPIKKIESHGIQVGESPSGISYDDKDKLIFVANAGSKSVSVINATNFQVVKFGKDNDIGLENITSMPFDLAYSDRGDLYVIDSTTEALGYQTRCVSGAITKLHFNEVNEHISLQDPLQYIIKNETANFCPVDVVVNKNSVAFAADPFNNTLYTIYPNNTITSMSLGPLPFGKVTGIGLVLDEDRETLFAANPSEGVQFIDLSKNEIRNLDLSNPTSCPIDITMDTEFDRIYVVDTNDNCNPDYKSKNGILFVIDASKEKIVKMIPLEQFPNNVVVDSKTHRVYVTNSGSNSLTVVDPLTFRTTRADAGTIPFGVTNDPNNGLVYTTSSGSNSVSMLDAKTNKIHHWVTFKVKPEGAGLIKCQGSYVTQNKLISVPDNTKCTAEATKLTSFVFQEWSGETSKSPGNVSQNLEFNANKSAINQLLESFSPASELPVETSDTYTAGFIESNSLFTQEQLTGLYVLAAGLFSGWLIPNLTHWLYSGRKSRIQNSTFSDYLQELQSPDKDIASIKVKMLKSLSEGRLSESQFDKLDEKLSIDEKRNSSPPGD